MLRLLQASSSARKLPYDEGAQPFAEATAPKGSQVRAKTLALDGKLAVLFGLKADRAALDRRIADAEREIQELRAVRSAASLSGWEGEAGDKRRAEQAERARGIQARRRAGAVTVQVYDASCRKPLNTDKANCSGVNEANLAVSGNSSLSESQKAEGFSGSLSQTSETGTGGRFASSPASEVASKTEAAEVTPAGPPAAEKKERQSRPPDWLQKVFEAPIRRHARPDFVLDSTGLGEIEAFGPALRRLFPEMRTTADVVAVLAHWLPRWVEFQRRGPNFERARFRPQHFLAYLAKRPGKAPSPAATGPQTAPAPPPRSSELLPTPRGPRPAPDTTPPPWKRPDRAEAKRAAEEAQAALDRLLAGVRAPGLEKLNDRVTFNGAEGAFWSSSPPLATPEDP